MTDDDGGTHVLHTPTMLPVLVLPKLMDFNLEVRQAVFVKHACCPYHATIWGQSGAVGTSQGRSILQVCNTRQSCSY